MDSDLGSNHDSKTEVLDVILFSFVMDLEIIPSFYESSLPGL